MSDSARNRASILFTWLRLPLALLFAFALPRASVAWCGEPANKKHALLVGCTKYQNENIAVLPGPTNDVRLIAAMLKEVSFPAGQITSLVGWPDDVAARPTNVNIVKGFDDLIAKAGPDTQIV